MYYYYFLYVQTQPALFGYMIRFQEVASSSLWNMIQVICRIGSSLQPPVEKLRPATAHSRYRYKSPAADAVMDGWAYQVSDFDIRHHCLLPTHNAGFFLTMTMVYS